MTAAETARRHLSGRVLGGAAFVVVLAILYPLVADRAGNPLAVFLLPPLFVALVGDPTETALVGVLSTVVAAVEGVATGLDGQPFAARVTIIVLATAAALVGASVRAQREHDLRGAAVTNVLTTAFQEGLVPRPVPPRGITAEARYRPAAPPLMLGGDFLDVITLPDDSAAFVIGDVTGHGPRAAAFGTRIRAGWKSVAHAMPDRPELWLEEVEAAFFGDARFDGYVTALSGRVERDGSMQFVCAGHPWPILVDGDGARLLEPERVGTLLGVPGRSARTATRVRLRPGSSVLMYTDGIFENRRTPGGRAGNARLVDAVRSMRGRVDLDELLEQFGPVGFDDDVALLLLGTGAG